MNGKNKAKNKAKNNRNNDKAAVAIQEDYLLSEEVGQAPTIARMKNAALQPILLKDVNWKLEVAPMFAVFTFALMLYGLTTPRQVALEDDGLFLMILEHFGVGHPPGYPLYSLLGTPFYHLLPDFLTPAFRGHLFSSFAAAIACSAIYAAVIMLVRNRGCALAAGIGYAVSEAFWSQAIIAEVYALNTAMYFIIFALCLRYSSMNFAEGKKSSYIALYAVIAFTYGISLTNHWPLIGLGSICLLMMVICQWRELIKRSPIGLFFLVIGLLPYAWLILRSHSNTQLNFYGPIDSLESLWFYVTRSGYVGVDNQAGVGIEEKISFSIFTFNQYLRQITPLGLVVSLVGFIAMIRNRSHCWLAVSMAVGWFMSGPLLIYLLNFKTEFIWFSAFRVYLLISYGYVLIWFGYGLAAIGSILSKRLSYKREAKIAVVALSSTVIVLSFIIHLKQNNRSDYTWGRDLAMFKLTQVDLNAKLFTFDDLDLPVGYLNLVEHVRPDIEIFNDQGLVFSSRLYSPFTTDKDKTKIINKYIDEIAAPIFYHPYRLDLFDSARNGSDFIGFWRRVNTDDDQLRIVLNEQLLYWLQDNLSSYHLIEDRWTRQQAAGIVATLVSSIVQSASSGYQLTPEWKETIALAYEKNELVRILLLWNAVHAKQLNNERAAIEIAWIESLVDNREDYIVDNSNLADLLYLKSLIINLNPEIIKGDPEVAFEEALLLSLDYEFKDNSYKTLMDYYRGKDRRQEALALLEDNYETISKAPINIRELHSLLLREIDKNKDLAPVLKFNEPLIK